MDKKAMHNTMKAITDLFQSIKVSTKNAIRTMSGNIDKDAHEGNAVAQYVAYTNELNHFMGLKLEVEKMLQMTKNSNARRKLLKRKSLIEQEILFYQKLQEEAVNKEPKV